MRKTSFFLITLIIMVFAFQAGALELGAGLWLPEGVFESAGNRSFEGSLKVLTVPGSPLGIGPVALVSETNLGSNLNQRSKTMIRTKPAKVFCMQISGRIRNEPPHQAGVSAQGLVSYGGTGFANVNLANEDSSYFTSLYWALLPRPAAEGHFRQLAAGSCQLRICA